MSQRTTPGAADGSPDGATEEYVTRSVTDAPAYWEQVTRTNALASHAINSWEREWEQGPRHYNYRRPPKSAAWKRRRNSRWYRVQRTGAIWHGFYLEVADVTRWSHWPSGQCDQPPEHTFEPGNEIETCPAGARRIPRPQFTNDPTTIGK